MNLGKPETKWEVASSAAFESLSRRIRRDKLATHGLGFRSKKTELAVSYEGDFESLLVEKFDIVPVSDDAPLLTFVPNDPSFELTLPYEHYGYLSPDRRQAIVFADSFGIFKSVISGFASLQKEPEGYVPTHASALQIGSRGILFIGGSGAGKTTSVLRIVDRLRRDNAVGILTDDWAIVKNDGKIAAETFDLSVSLRERDILGNPDIRFSDHDAVVRAIRERKKVSYHPDVLYGDAVAVHRVDIDTIVVLEPVAGTEELRPLDAESLAQAAVETAYHYPYTDREQIARHLDSWRMIHGRVTSYSFCTRPESDSDQDLAPVLELLS